MVEKILLQGTVTFLAILVLLRTLGLRPDAFRLVLVVALGGVLTASLIDSTVSLGTALGALGLVVVLQAALSRFVPQLLQPQPEFLLEHGHLRHGALQKFGLAEADVHAAVRKAGLGDLGDVAAVVREADGALTVIPAAALGDGSAIAGLAGHAAREFAGPRYMLRQAAEPKWRAGVMGALAGTMAMLLYASAAFGYLGAGTWVPYYALAARLDFPPPLVLAVTVLLQLGLGTAWGPAYAWLSSVVTKGTVARDALLGLVFGLVVYVVMGLVVGPIFVPAMRSLVPNHYLFGNLVFGLVTALVAASLQPRPRVTITFAPRPTAVREEAER